MNNRETPLVSVVVPTFNRHELLLETLSSIIKQTYKNTEIIVVSDGYDHKLRDILHDYIIKDNFHFYETYHTGNPSRARNFGICIANGDFIAFCDDDDLWMQNKLERQMSKFIKSTSCLCYSNMARFDDNGSTWESPIENTAHAVTFQELLYRNTIPMSSIIIRKQFVEVLGGFSELNSLGGSEDFEFLLRWRYSNPFISVNENLVMYRSSRNRMTPTDEERTTTSSLIYLYNIFATYYHLIRSTNVKVIQLVMPYLYIFCGTLKVIAYDWIQGLRVYFSNKR